ncbi:MAG TPA: glycosyltransferase [Anaerolineae bacterium]|nr:glycosyltransferase [Anaerolineae bacterium]
MFISIVVPALNEEKYIAQCLSSLHTQSYPSELYEIIVVDNASTDRTAEIAQEFGVMVVHEPERGVGRARHRGAEEARGDIIAGTDADAIATPTWLEEIARAFRSDELLGAVTGPILLHDGNSFQRWGARYVSNPTMRLSYTLSRGVISGNNFAVRTRDYWRAGGFNTSLLSAEDIDLGVRLSAIARTLFDPNMVMYVSARRTREGYVKLFLRTSQDFVRVVFLRMAPAGKDFVPIR